MVWGKLLAIPSHRPNLLANYDRGRVKPKLNGKKILLVWVAEGGMDEKNRGRVGWWVSR